MSQETFHLTEAAMAEYAGKIAENLRAPCVLLLKGDLGMGKTSFARSLIGHLSHDQSLIVPSPTFTLVQIYDTQKGLVYHFDLYRLTSTDQIYDLDWDEALNHIALVEWPERLEGYTPPNAFVLSFEYGDDDNHRTLTWETTPP